MRIKMLLNLIKVCRSTDVLYYLVDVLKLNNQKNHVYRLKSGLKIYIRNGTSDRGEMLSIISGEEYGSLLNYFKKYSGEHLTIIDAGANIGLFSLFIYKHFNLRKTILIEPDEENLDSLYKNIKMNNLSNKQCKIYKNALYKNNSILLFDDALDYHARRISNRGKKKVKGITIKNIFEDDKLNHVDIFKIDIEGAEWTLLQQSNRKYFNKCKLIILEYHLSKKFSNVFIITSYFKKWHICIKAKDGKMGLLYMINPKIKL